LGRGDRRFESSRPNQLFKLCKNIEQVYKLLYNNYMAGEDIKHNQLPEHGRELKPYQEDGLRAIEQARYEAIPSGYLNWANGLDKSEVVAHSVKKYLEDYPSGRALILGHHNNTLRQLSESFGRVINAYSSGHMFGQELEDRGRVVFASFQVMNRKLGNGHVFEAFNPHEFGYEVIDELHNGPAPTHRKVIDYFQASFKLGLTAPPKLSGRQDISEIFGHELNAISLEDAISKGWLAKPS